MGLDTQPFLCQFANPLLLEITQQKFPSCLPWALEVQGQTGHDGRSQASKRPWKSRTPVHCSHSRGSERHLKLILAKCRARLLFATLGHGTGVATTQPLTPKAAVPGLQECDEALFCLDVSVRVCPCVLSSSPGTGQHKRGVTHGPDKSTPFVSV